MIENCNDLGFMRPREVCAALGCNKWQLIDWSKRGLIPCQRTAGGHRRYDPADVKRIAESLATRKGCAE